MDKCQETTQVCQEKQGCGCQDTDTSCHTTVPDCHPGGHEHWHHEPPCDGPHRPWGPHGPDGMYVPKYVWPDVYHPVPYGKEYKGNQNLSLEGEHWCPPRDHGRHGCEPNYHNHGCYSHLPCNFVDVMDDYLDTARRLLDATTYQERCSCVEELRRIKVKMEEILKEFDHQLDNNDREVGRLKEKVKYYIGKMECIITDHQELMIAVEEQDVLDYTDYFTKEEVEALKLANPYPLYVNGVKYDGSARVEIATTQISRSGKTLVIR